VLILFDQGTPVPLREALPNHEVETAYEPGWSTLKNGDLLDVAERNSLDVFVTTDSRLRYQQNLTDRRIAVVCLLSASWPRIRRVISSVILRSKPLPPEPTKRYSFPMTTANLAVNRARASHGPGARR
jgi:hypothetical protein